MAEFVERTLRAKEANGEAFDMVLRVGNPHPSKVDWACTVSITRLSERPRELFGIDSWQALQIGLQLIAHELDGFISRGGQLFWPSTEESVKPQELFACLPSWSCGNEA